MIDNHANELKELRERIELMGSYLHINDKRGKLRELDKIASAADFWNDRERAQSITRQAARLRDAVDEYDRAAALLDDADAANELAIESDDTELATEVVSALKNLYAQTDALELNSWFTNEFDDGDCIVSINPGQGGLEAQDWTDMLLHMYLKYCARRGWDVQINDVQPGEAIGIDRATFTVYGRNAYGMLSSEAGVHRLVRISPTDVKKRRHTTFAGVEVLPVIPDDIEVEINEEDIRVDVYHSSGHGGQGVNTTDSAVRLTHVPTGIVVTCQNERSQIQNKATAMGILRSKLYELEKAKRAEELDELRGPKHDISWGNQIRNYVLYPYQRVKDLRSGVETGNVDAVLKEGDLDLFVIAYHRWRVEQKA